MFPYPENRVAMVFSQTGLETGTVTWSPSRDLHVTGQIYYQEIGTSQVDSRAITWRDSAVTLSGLTAGATYSCYIALTEANPNTVKSVGTFSIGIYTHPTTIVIS